MTIPPSGDQTTSEQGSSGSRRARLRIAWESPGGGETKGVVTFHGLDDRLTRVELEMEYDPSVPVEWVGNLLRIPRRRSRRDLKLSKRDEQAEIMEEPEGAEEPEDRAPEEPEEPEEPEAESSAQWQVRRRAPGRPSRPRRR